jgi:hypothetical protein
VVDRGEPAASCSEWHGDGTAGEDEPGSGLAAIVTPAQAMGEVRPRTTIRLVGWRAGASRMCAQAPAECARRELPYG